MSLSRSSLPDHPPEPSLSAVFMALRRCIREPMWLPLDRAMALLIYPYGAGRAVGVRCRGMGYLGIVFSDEGLQYTVVREGDVAGAAAGECTWESACGQDGRAQVFNFGFAHEALGLVLHGRDRLALVAGRLIREAREQARGRGQPNLSIEVTHDVSLVLTAGEGSGLLRVMFGQGVAVCLDYGPDGLAIDVFADDGGRLVAQDSFEADQLTVLTAVG